MIGIMVKWRLNSGSQSHGSKAVHCEGRLVPPVLHSNSDAPWMAATLPPAAAPASVRGGALDLERQCSPWLGGRAAQPTVQSTERQAAPRGGPAGAHCRGDLLMPPHPSKHTPRQEKSEMSHSALTEAGVLPPCRQHPKAESRRLPSRQGDVRPERRPKSLPREKARANGARPRSRPATEPWHTSAPQRASRGSRCMSHIFKLTGKHGSGVHSVWTWGPPGSELEREALSL